MNLLEEKWLPVRRSTGQVDWIAPHQITEPNIVAFAANRADFNGALVQMMIGLWNKRNGGVSGNMLNRFTVTLLRNGQ